MSILGLQYARTCDRNTTMRSVFKEEYWALRVDTAPSCKTRYTEFYVHGTVHHVSTLNKSTRCNWAVIFITALLDYSTCFGRLLHPSSGARRRYIVQTLPRRKAVIRGVICARGCIYSRRAPDDGCKRRPKHVE